jgi:hypothetical protein
MCKLAEQPLPTAMASSVVIVLALSFGLLGCKRLPASAVPTARVAPTSPQTASKAVIAPEVAARIEPIAELCTRTCDHWIELRFSVPVGLDTMRAGAATEAEEFFERQREHNQSRCEDFCVKSGDRERAKCVLLSNTAKEAGECSNPKAGNRQTNAGSGSDYPRPEQVTPKRPGVHRRYISPPTESRRAPRRPVVPRSPNRVHSRFQ